MSLIFISHSSKDNAKAEEIIAWLEAKGFESIFLDFDPEQGIPAGRNWEREIYRRLHRCRSVVFLCSEHSMASKWCFTEIAFARSLGKYLFPLKIAPCAVHGPIADTQLIDLTANPEEGYKRLWRGLIRAGLDPLDYFQWDSKRSPYPGLRAFQEEDAAVFFGRNDSIHEGLNTLNNLRRYGGRRMVLFLGASGSGKSSLMRAGILPRMKRDSDAWLVVDPFRPKLKPFDEFALVLSTTFGSYGKNRDWESIVFELHRSAKSHFTDGAKLIELSRELGFASRKTDATVVLAIDQFEELLGADPNSQNIGFLTLLRTALEKEDSPFIVIGTLRSDFLWDFQNHPILRDVQFEKVMIGP